jgi:hypothetical protein
MNELRTMGLLIDQKQKHKYRVLTKETLHNIGARLEHTPRKSLKRLAQETGVSKSSARTVTQLLKLGPYKTTVIHALQLRDPASRVHFCNWFQQSVVEDEIDPQLTFCPSTNLTLIDLGSNRGRRGRKPEVWHGLLYIILLFFIFLSIL